MPSFSYSGWMPVLQKCCFLKKNFFPIMRENWVAWELYDMVILCEQSKAFTLYPMAKHWFRTDNYASYDVVLVVKSQNCKTRKWSQNWFCHTLIPFSCWVLLLDHQLPYGFPGSAYSYILSPIPYCDLRTKRMRKIHLYTYFIVRRYPGSKTVDWKHFIAAIETKNKVCCFFAPFLFLSFPFLFPAPQ